MKVIIGIDPGSRFTGYGVVVVRNDEPHHLDHGVIAIPETLRFADKLKFLNEKLQALFVQFRPTDVVVEKIFLGKNADSAFKLGHVRGVCLQAAAVAGSEIFEYAARSVKKNVTGTGAASKDHVRLVVSQLLGLRLPVQVDATDALSMAICHCRLRGIEERIQRQLQKVEL